MQHRESIKANTMSAASIESLIFLLIPFIFKHAIQIHIAVLPQHSNL